MSHNDTHEHDTQQLPGTDSCGCSTRHPLERDGTSQAQRLLAALNTSYVSVDERKLEDLLSFARDYAKMLNFHKAKFVPAEGKKVLTAEANAWETFLRKDISVLVAGVAREDVSRMRIEFRRTLNALNATPNVALLKQLFTPLKDVLTKLNTWYIDSDAQTLFHLDINVYFQSVFLDGYLRMQSIDAGATAVAPGNPLNILGDLSFNSSWTELISDATPYAGPTAYEGDTDAERLKSAAFAIQTVFEKFAGTLQMIVSRTPVYLQETIENYPYHKAHMGLFITFLELFAHAQNHLNRITDRHLNFFYQEVLRIAPKKAVADKVHLIFQLAKNTAQFKVPEDTKVKAGKDAKGKDLYYGTDDTLIANQAKVALFKSLFIDTLRTGALPTSAVTATGLFGASMADSSDGKGGVLDEALPQWKAFGSVQQKLPADQHTLPDARTGFAIASAQLNLAEGERVIKLRVLFKTGPNLQQSGISLSDLTKKENYSIRFTSEKGWIAPKEVAIAYDTGSKELTFTLTLNPVQPAITAYKTAVHEGTFAATQPVVKIEFLNFNPDSAPTTWNNVYAALRSAQVQAMHIDLKVSGVKNLTLHNEFSALDPAKPFMPFGPQPVVGSAFFVGSDEVLFKKLDTFSLHVDWHGTPASFASHYANYVKETTSVNNNTVTTTSNAINVANTDFLGKYKTLSGGQWVEPVTSFESYKLSDETGANKQGSSAYLFHTTDPQARVVYRFSNLYTTRAAADDRFDAQITNANRGYIKITLDGKDFLHREFPGSLALQSLIRAKGTTPTAALTGSMPLTPYIPFIKTLSASYTSNQQLNADDQFFHLQPFGEQRVDMPVDAASTRYFLPQFVRFATNAAGSTERKEQKAMLFIGLEGVVPQQSLSLLVQVVDDSGNPNVQAPAINWSYLRNNEWVGLNRQQIVSDTSNGFQTSGIVELDIPSDATNTNTILPAGYHWLRASAEEYISAGDLFDPSALNNVLSITAQAIRASFRDAGNDPQHLANPLEAGKITKLADPFPEIKSVAQPFASFDGKVAEQGSDYYRRVSERLRHKGRAVTAWDYERLVLEQFPSIYKVKCISHTLDLQSRPDKYAELAPGHVCITVVSNLRNQNQVNLLRPSTSINTRNEIKKFLSQRSSKFARISVINPQYEAIQVKCNVTYLPEYQKDKGYYDQELIADLRKFLSPWAYDEGKDIQFGGKIHKSYIINFIEERHYVDYLTDFEMYKLPEPGSPEDEYEPVPREELSAAHAKSILVSADTHLINTHSE